MSQEEYEAGAMEEAHYYQTLLEVVYLMNTHGYKQVLCDLMEIAIEQEANTSTIN